MTRHPRISVAIPLYNEQSLVAELLRRTLAILDQLPGGPHQLVVADDGSTDQTFDLLSSAAAQDERIVVLQLSRNFGHQVALTAALDHVQGDAVVMMDGDLQDPPEVIPDLLARFQQGFDVVYAIRAGRKESFFLKVCYRAYYRLVAILADVSLPHDAGDFCIASMRVVEAMRGSRERHRYLRGLRSWAGYRQTGLVIERGARYSGRSKYSWSALLGLALDGMFSFSILPIRLAIWTGVATIALSAVMLLFWIAAKFLGYSPQGFTALATSIAFFAGVQLVFLGIIGEYIGRIYEEVKRRPLYLVQRRVNGTDLWNERTLSNTAGSTNNIGGGESESRSCSERSVAATGPNQATSSSISDAATD